MRTALKTLFASLLLCLLASLASAQTLTNVTGTITDPNGLAYSNAQISFQLVGSGNYALTPCSNSQTNCVLGALSFPVTAGTNGSFSISLYANASIKCGATPPTCSSYTVTVSEPGIAPPAGTGPQTFTVTGVTIAGASQSLSATLSAAAPALSNITGGGGSLPCTTAGAGGVQFWESGTAFDCDPGLLYFPNASTDQLSIGTGSGGSFGELILEQSSTGPGEAIFNNVAGFGTALVPNPSPNSALVTLPQFTASLLPAYISTPTNGDCAKWDSANGSKGLLADAGAACGSGGGATLQTNGTNNASQTLLNFVNPSSFNGLTFTFSNTSGGIETFALGGTLGNAGLTNPSITINTSSPLGGGGTFALGSSNTLTCSTCNTTAAVANPPFDKSATGLSNPTADATFTQPAASVTGWSLAGTAPASVATTPGTNGSSLLNVTAPAGGATSNAAGVGGVGGSPAVTAGAGGAGTGTNASGGAGGALTLTAGNGGTSSGTAANSNGGSVTAVLGTAGTGGSGAVGKQGIFQVQGTLAGFWGCTQGSAPTTSNANIAANSIFHFCPSAVTAYSAQEPSAASNGLLDSVNNTGSITQSFTGDSNHAVSVLAQTATSSGTICAATAGTACGQAGQYRVSYDIWGSGTACTSVTAGKVVFTFTWTDPGGSSHLSVPLYLYDYKSAAQNVTGTFNFNTALTSEGANGIMILSSNGSGISYVATYTACTTGTGTYNARFTTEQIQ